jgi:hypothetical protein
MRPSAFSETLVVEGLRLLKDLLLSRGGTPDSGDGTGGQIASQLATINARLSRMDAKLDQLLGKKGKTPPAGKGKLDPTLGERGPVSPSAIVDDPKFQALENNVRELGQRVEELQKGVEADRKRLDEILSIVKALNKKKS